MTKHSPETRSPQQDRSKETLRKILVATEELLSKEPAEELSIRQVLALSGVSNGSFYSRFANKDALIKECWKGLVESLDEEWDLKFDEFEFNSLSERVGYLVKWQVDRFYKHRGLYRAYVNLLRTTDLKPTRQNLYAYAKLEDKRTRFLMVSADEIAHPDPRHAIKMAIFVTYAAARELVFYPQMPHASSIKMSKSRLIKELTSVFLSCLGISQQG